MCKLNTKDYEPAIDQCEMVLEKDPRNTKACFRMATAIYQKTDKCTAVGTEGQIRSVYNYLKKANESTPSDVKIREFLNEVKEKYDKYQEDQSKKQREQEEKEVEKKAESTEAPAQKGLKRVRVTDPEEEKHKEAPKEEPRIQEEEKKQPEPQPQQQYPQQNYGYPPNMPDYSNMSDDQLNVMIEQMRNNKEFAKQALVGNGQNIDDAQLDMMLNMMTPQMMRMSMQMMKDNPSLMQNHRARMGQQAGAQPQQTAAAAAPTQGQAPPTSQPQMPAGMPANMAEMMDNPMIKEMLNNPETMRNMMNMMGNQGQGGPMSAEGMQEMMKDPSLKNMMKNPEAIANMLNMVKSNPALKETLAKQIGIEPDQLDKGLGVFKSILGAYSSVRNFFANKVVQLSILLLIIYTLFRYFG